MCLILIAYNTHPLFKLVMAANRDEFYNRPTAPLATWADEPGIVAGRDLKGRDHQLPRPAHAKTERAHPGHSGDRFSHR